MTQIIIVNYKGIFFNLFFILKIFLIALLEYALPAKPYTVSVGKPIMPFFLRILIILIKFFELNLIIFE